MPGGKLAKPVQLELITAQEARKRYAKPEYVETLRIVTEAILEASTGNREVVVAVSGSHENYRVLQHLRDYGYDVLIQQDPENGSHEITVRWF